MRPISVVPVLLASLLLPGCNSTDAAGSQGGSYAQMNPDPQYLQKGDTRTFDISYTAQVKEVPAGTTKLCVWVPVPQDTPVQKISKLTFQGQQPKVGTEAKYGNKIAYWEIDKPTGPLEVTYTFTCARQEVKTDMAAAGTDGKETDATPAMFLKDDKLTIVDARIKKMAADATAGKTTTLDKSKAIYQYVLDKMAYDKSGQGWGRGDTNFACDVGKGNCTDFHALFMSLARASGIPSGFEIGLYLPYEKGKQEPPGGYHCWSYFRVPGKTWVPVDASEADRFPERAAYFFGSHTSNRVTLSVGRDLVLVPAQKGEPVNYLLNPYAEADGKSIATAKTWTYKDV